MGHQDKWLLWNLYGMIKKHILKGIEEALDLV